MSTYIDFEVPATVREKYQLEVDPADEARVADMSSEDLEDYINENSSDWDYRGSHCSETVENGGLEEVDVYEFNCAGPHKHLVRP